MIFNSFSFAVFYICVLISCLLLKSHKKNFVLLLASYFFYAYLHWQFVFLLLATTLINYLCAILLDKSDTSKKKIILWISIALSLGILAYFKYLGFFIDSVNAALTGLHIGIKLPLLQILLPVGISFFTFQALTYTMDVYSGKLKASSNFIDIALFVSFFPTILSGPIEKARCLLPQIQQAKTIRFEDLMAGGKLFLWGLFKKMVIADRLASYVDFSYSYGNNSSVTLIVTAIFYSFQIYADFSGYSDMAIGIARTLGFKLTNNFNYPYFATSIKEFWKRWHISLTSWFSEYVYIPLGGNRVKRIRWIFNISIVFLLSGFWHGAKWSFILWGALHAFSYLAEFYWNKICRYKIKPLSGLLVFCVVTVAWIFFRIENVDKSIEIIHNIFTAQGSFLWGMSSFTTILAFVLLGLFLVLDWIRYKKIRFSPTITALGYAGILSMILLFGVTNTGFVYFQF